MTKLGSRSKLNPSRRKKLVHAKVASRRSVLDFQSKISTEPRMKKYPIMAERPLILRVTMRSEKGMPTQVRRRR